MLSLGADVLGEFDNENFRDDVLECCVRKILDSFPEHCTEARELAKQIADPEIADSLMLRLAKMLVVTNPAPCLLILKEDLPATTETSALVTQFIAQHSKNEFTLCCQAFKLLTNLQSRKEALLAAKDNFGWVTNLKAPQIAKLLSSCCQKKSLYPTFAKLILAISSYNPYLALLIALFEKTVQTDPKIAFEAVQSLVGTLRKLRCLAQFYNHCKWEDQQYVLEIAQGLQNSTMRSIFLREAIQRILPTNFSRAVNQYAYKADKPLPSFNFIPAELELENMFR